MMPMPRTENTHICPSDVTTTSLLRFLSPLGTPGERIPCSDTQENGCCALEWCKEQPAMTVVQFVVGWVIFAVGYPFRSSLMQSIFSKILGPVPQVKHNRKELGRKKILDLTSWIIIQTMLALLNCFIRIV